MRVSKGLKIDFVIMKKSNYDEQKQKMIFLTKKNNEKQLLFSERA